MANPVLRPFHVVLLFLGVLLVSPLAFSDSFARIVRLSDVEGDVQIDRNTGHGFERAILNMPITQGVRLQTGMTGRAEIEFENGSVVRMAGDSSVEFTRLSLRSNGERISEISVGNGTVYVDAHHKGDEQFRVAVGNHVFTLDRNVHLRLVVDQSRAQIAVMKGELRVPGPVEMAKVKKNQTFTLDFSDASQDTLAKGISALPTDDYDRERSQYDNQYARNNIYGSPFSYGYSDMYRYGSFFNLPGYGLVWQPASVGMGWDPYSNGYWSLYPGQGYVWVSSYPWGWTPYRYGGWLFVPNYGWCWRPGAWNQWNTGVVVYNPPPAWKGPIVPSQGSGTTVVVGKPLPPPVRPIWTDDLNSRRHGLVSPVTGVANPVPRTNAGSSSAVTSGTPPIKEPTTTTRPSTPGSVTPEWRTDAPHRGRTEPSMAPPKAPTRTMTPPPAPRVEPSRSPAPMPRMSSPPTTAPAPRMAPPSRSMGSGFHPGGGFHPMAMPSASPSRGSKK